MKLKLLLTSALLVTASVASFAQKPSYCHPQSVISHGDWEKAATQSTHRIIVQNVNNASSPQELINFAEDIPAKKRADQWVYRWVQDENKFTVHPGDKLAITVKSGIWTAEQYIFFDFNCDGDFDAQYAAFGDITQPMSETNSSWNKAKYADTWAKAAYRKELEKTAAKNEVVSHTFNITVPENAVAGECVMRVVSDGDGSGWRTSPTTACSEVSWAGNVFDLGMTIEPSQAKVQRPAEDPMFVMNIKSSELPDNVLRIRLYNTNATDAVIDWGDGSPLEKIAMAADGADPEATTKLKGALIQHTSLTTDPIVSVWASDVEGVYFSKTGVAALTLHHASNLKKLVVDKNFTMKALDLSECDELSKLDASNNWALDAIVFPEDQSHVTSLEVYNCGLTKLDVSKMTNLTYLSCEENKDLKGLNIGKNNTKLEKVFVYGNGLSVCDLDVIYSHLPDMTGAAEKPLLLVLNDGNESNKNDVDHSTTSIASQKNWLVRKWHGDQAEVTGDGTGCKNTYINEVIKAGIHVSANQKRGYIQVTIPQGLSSRVTVYALNGAAVYNNVFTDSIRINIAGWTPGAYIVRVLDNNYKVIVQ